MSTPKVTSILSVALISLSALNFILIYYHYFLLVVKSNESPEEPQMENMSGPDGFHIPLLTFIPGVSPVLSQPWVFATSALIERSMLVPAVLAIFSLGSFLESRWGPKELLKYIAVVGCGSNIVLYAYYMARICITDLQGEIPPISSSAGIIMGLLVGLKQRISNHYVILFSGRFRIKVAYFPFLLTMASGFCGLFSRHAHIVFMLCITSFFLSWSYLRYFKSSSNERHSYILPMRRTPSATLEFEEKTVRGDRSNSFALETFFPRPLSLLVAKVGTLVFSFMVQRHWVESKDYLSSEEPEDEMATLQSGLFSLSPLKGAKNVSVFSGGGWFWAWISPKKTDSINARRKLALREFE
ncbi:putative transmembrane protein [Clavispora lusitaniae]|uniref:Transmembrane protein n=1 Tax=Clavispora lusitaniae TaxID=36911 RepID=A0AA91T0Y5_CLALS|nr:putative transmembrane protein [Clavispora lusitaniae]